jgi:HEPN domain-containing protein
MDWRTKYNPLSQETHNLIDLVQRGRLSLTQAQREFIGKLNNASVVTRYPDDLAQITTQYPESITREYLEKTKELIAWVRQDPRLQPS